MNSLTKIFLTLAFLLMGATIYSDAMGAATISPEIKKQYFDDSGFPLSGGKLYVYEAGTTTLKTSYTTEAASTANANPFEIARKHHSRSILSMKYDSRIGPICGK